MTRQRNLINKEMKRKLSTTSRNKSIFLFLIEVERLRKPRESSPDRARHSTPRTLSKVFGIELVGWFCYGLEDGSEDVDVGFGRTDTGTVMRRKELEVKPFFSDLGFGEIGGETVEELGEDDDACEIEDVEAVLGHSRYVVPWFCRYEHGLE